MARPPFDVAIAGGGLAGLASAWYLNEAGYRVALIDAAQPGRAASWAGGGILFPIYPWKYPLPVQRLAQRGRAIYDRFTRNVDAISGIDSENRRTGLCVLDADEIGAGLNWAREYHEPVDTLDCATLARMQPGLAATPSALYFPQAAQVRNPRLCRSLTAALMARGVEIISHRRVTGIHEQQGWFAGFVTDGGIVHAARGVIACGAWSTVLLQSYCRIPVFPVKGQMILLHGGRDRIGPVLLRGGRYVIPRRDGRILVGSTLEEDAFDTRTDAATAQSLQASAAGMMPSLAELSVESQWAGLRPATQDGCPIIGAVDALPGLYVNTAQYRNGVLCAPASAEVLFQSIDCDAAAPVAAFDPARRCTPGVTSKSY